MSNSNINLQTQSSNALHNAIMEAGSTDRPPMLAGNEYSRKGQKESQKQTKPSTGWKSQNQSEVKSQPHEENTT
ncbi:hypothetical protein Tco_1182283 [Tanacetum coccineum]